MPQYDSHTSSPSSLLALLLIQYNIGTKNIHIPFLSTNISSVMTVITLIHKNSFVTESFTSWQQISHLVRSNWVWAENWAKLTCHIFTFHGFTANATTVCWIDFFFRQESVFRGFFLRKRALSLILGMHSVYLDYVVLCILFVCCVRVNIGYIQLLHVKPSVSDLQTGLSHSSPVRRKCHITLHEFMEQWSASQIPSFHCMLSPLRGALAPADTKTPYWTAMHPGEEGEIEQQWMEEWNRKTDWIAWKTMPGREAEGEEMGGGEMQ